MIVQVQMINCQSWKNSTFDLATDRINVIIADNGTGKSVFFKMLKITTNPNYFSRAERKDLIRRHEECATILFKFDDGSIAATKVFQTYVLYMYKASNQEGLKTAYEQFPEVLEKLGLIVDPDETSFVANIIDADQDLLLVNSKLKYNYNLVHLLVESPELELVNERAHTALMNVLNPLSSLSSRCETLERAIQDSTYYDVAERELELDRVEKMKDFLFDLIPVAENLHSMQEVSRNYIDVNSIKKLLGLLDLLESVDLSQVVVTDKPANIAEHLKLLKSLSAINLNDLKTVDRPFDVSNYFELIRLLSDLKLQELQTIEAPVNCNEIFSLLSILTDLNLASLHLTEQVPDLTDHFKLINDIFYLQQILALTDSLMLTVNSARKEMQELEIEMQHSGKITECAIYGKVIYNGKKCIPYRN